MGVIHPFYKQNVRKETLLRIIIEPKHCRHLCQRTCNKIVRVNNPNVEGFETNKQQLAASERWFDDYYTIDRINERTHVIGEPRASGPVFNPSFAFWWDSGRASKPIVLDENRVLITYWATPGSQMLPLRARISG